MHIALMPSAFHPSLGGVEELSRQLAHHLAAEGHRVTLATNRWPRDLPERETFEGLTVRRYAFRVPERNARQLAGAVLLGGRTLRRLCEDLRDADILHAQCVSSNVHYALLARQRLGRPLVVSLQGELTMDATGLFQRSAFARDLMRRALDQADAVTACSAHTLKEAEAFFGRPLGDKARVIYNGIRLADFENVAPHVHGGPYILAIGRHVAQKGFDVLLTAYARAGVGLDLILAGEGPETEALQRQARALGIASCVVFPGRTDRARTAALFAGCEMFVLPSRHEPQGIVVLEAMAAGKPVIATRVGGVPEVVQDGQTGVLAPAADAEALAAAIRELAGRPDYRRQLGQAGRQHAARFDWRQITAEYQGVYAAVRAKTAEAARS